MLRPEHIDLIQAWALLARAERKDGARASLTGILRFGLEAPMETGRHPIYGADLRREWSGRMPMSEEAAKILPPDISFRKAQGRDKPCTGDHCIPLAVTAGHLMDHAEDRAVIAETMAYAWRVVLITKSEDVQLREAGLQSAMPDEWRWGDDPFMRYHAVGIRLADYVVTKKIPASPD